MDRKKLGAGIGIGAAIAVTGALVFGGYAVFHGVGQSANAQTVAYTGPVATSVAAPAQDDAAAQSIYDQQIAQQQAAAAAAAQQAQAEAEAAAQTAAPVKKAATTTTPSNTGNPKGTPLPFTKSSDPQNANGGDYADPATFCASRSASTVGGVPQCD